MKSPLEARLVTLAHKIGLERTAELIKRWRAEELVKTYGLTPGSKVTPCLSSAERKLVKEFLRGDAPDRCRCRHGA
jgi:hypothetical protein